MATSRISRSPAGRPGLRAIVALSIGLFLLTEGISILTSLPPWLLYVDPGSGLGESLRRWAVRCLDSNLGRNLFALQPVASLASGLALMLAVAVTSGGAAYRMRRHGATRTKARLPALAVLLLAYAAGKPVILDAWVSSLMERTKLEGAAVHEKLRQKLESGTLPLEHREAAWKLYASGVFTDTGERVEVPAPGGGTRPYEPTAGEIRFRDMQENIVVEMHPSWRPVAAWGIVAAASAAVGLRFARRVDEPPPPEPEA